MANLSIDGLILTYPNSDLTNFKEEQKAIYF